MTGEASGLPEVLSIHFFYRDFERKFVYGDEFVGALSSCYRKKRLMAGTKVGKCQFNFHFLDELSRKTLNSSLERVDRFHKTWSTHRPAVIITSILFF